MTIDVKVLLEEFSFTSSEIKNLKEELINSFGDPASSQKIFDRQLQCQQQTNCHGCDMQGFCHIMVGIASLNLSHNNTAIKEFQSGYREFNSRNETWNSILSLALLCLTYEQNGEYRKASAEVKNALNFLKKYERLQVNNYNEREKINNLKLQLDILLEQANSFVPASEVSEVSHPPPPNDASQAFGTVNTLNDYLSLFSIPVYGTVTAGSNGELFVEPVRNSSTIVYEIEIEGNFYEVLSLAGTSINDRQVTLVPQESYGWAKVRGRSMNAWKIPLDEKDYVLFRKSSDAKDSDFVIIASQDALGDRYLMVKRYDKSNKQFLSKSKDEMHPPIQADENYSILGVVIAVAKSIES
ncbi:MAG: S24 family peptidase [Anaerolineae bacterium]|nr:S24 family peptidase [Anaerolineae bacterium]